MEQETRIAVVGIIVENKEAVGEVNQILHDYSPILSEEWDFHMKRNM